MTRTRRSRDEGIGGNTGSAGGPAFHGAKARLADSMARAGSTSPTMTSDSALGLNRAAWNACSDERLIRSTLSTLPRGRRPYG